MKIETLLEDTRVLPVLAIERLVDALPLAEALETGGLTTLEITLRAPEALAAVETVARARPALTLGVGSLRHADQIAAAADAGAVFGVSPGAADALLEAAEVAGFPLLPGAQTPSEMMRLLQRGYRRQKFFPAELAGGTAFLRAVAGPLPEIAFCPTGGVGVDTAPEYLALDNVFCVGGSWMAAPELVRARDWPAIERLAAAAAKL